MRWADKEGAPRGGSAGLTPRGRICGLRKCSRSLCGAPLNRDRNGAGNIAFNFSQMIQNLPRLRGVLTTAEDEANFNAHAAADVDLQDEEE